MTDVLTPDAPVREHDGRTLDWRPRFDPRSLDHRVAAAVRSFPATGKVWQPGPARLDQGREGACVGYGCTDTVAAEPVPVPGLTNRTALAYYHRAQQLDEWPGESYEGTSVLAGCLTGRERGYWTGFRWAKSAEELAAGIVAAQKDGGGPAVIGVEWRAGSYATDALGVLRPSGDVVGGHCLAVLGFVPMGVSRDSEAGQALVHLDLWDGYLSAGSAVFVILNSWGPSFGINGLCLVTAETMRAWSRAGAEFALPVGRAVPTRKASSRDEAPATPATAGADRTLHLKAAALREGDRVLECVPALLGQRSVTVQGVRRVTGHLGAMVRVDSTAGVFTLRASSSVTVRRTVA